MPVHRVFSAALFLFSVTAFAAEAARAADFHVENAVFVEGQSQPQSQGVTIFREGLVYDFLNEPAEVIILDKAHKRFVLLDATRRVRSEISMDYVQAFARRAKQRLSGDPNPNVKWLADPSFGESFNQEKSELTLKSESMTYQAEVQAAGPAVAAQYHDFSDGYAQFNYMFNPKSRPPFPRMMLNAAIDRRQGVAKEVRLTTVSDPKDAPVKITSRHQLAEQLDAADVRRVAEAREHLRSFASVSFREYREGK